MVDVHIDLEKMQPVAQVTEKVKGLTNEKPTFRICENTCADKLRSNFKLYSSVCVGPVRKTHCWFSHDATQMLSAIN